MTVSSWRSILSGSWGLQALLSQLEESKIKARDPAIPWKYKQEALEGKLSVLFSYFKCLKYNSSPWKGTTFLMVVRQAPKTARPMEDVSSH